MKYEVQIPHIYDDLECHEYVANASLRCTSDIDIHDGFTFLHPRRDVQHAKLEKEDESFSVRKL